jgi:hypothetical protein
MAKEATEKKTEEKKDNLSSEPKEATISKPKKTAAKVEKKAEPEKPFEPQIGLEKYFQLVNPPIHIYTRAALVETYRGIMKVAKAWENEMKPHVGE